MPLPMLRIYSSIECGAAYVSIYRLRRVWPAYAGRVSLVWHALPLECKGGPEVTTGPARRGFQLEVLRRMEPQIPVEPWDAPAWSWPTTYWPAFEALACAQAQGPEVAYAMSWALRLAFFAQSRPPLPRGELFEIAGEVARSSPLDLPRFHDDWDTGRYKETIIADALRGWDELRVEGSPTYLLPDGRQIANPAAGRLQVDADGSVTGYTPPEVDPLDVYRALLEETIALGQAGGPNRTGGPLHS